MKVRNLHELQDIFNVRYEKIKNKTLLIEDELKQIDEFFETEGKNIYRQDLVDFLISIDRVPNSVFNTHWIYPPTGYFFDFKKYYEGYLYEEIELPIPDNKPTENIPQKDIDINMEGLKPVRLQAIELAKYTIWLKELKSTNTLKPQKKKDTLSQKQKLLALHYLGLDFRNHDYIKSAKVLQEIYGHHFEDSRKLMPMLYDTNNTLKTSDNLRSVLNIFKSIGFTDAVEDIQKDLDNCKKNT